MSNAISSLVEHASYFTLFAVLTPFFYGLWTRRLKESLSRGCSSLYSFHTTGLLAEGAIFLGPQAFAPSRKPDRILNKFPRIDYSTWLRNEVGYRTTSIETVLLL